jgi:hypothetical protein
MIQYDRTMLDGRIVDIPSYFDVELLRQKVDAQAICISGLTDTITSLINVLEAAMFPPDIWTDKGHMEDTFATAIGDLRAGQPVDRI